MGKVRVLEMHILPPFLPAPVGSKKLQAVPQARLGYKVGIPVAAIFLILVIAGLLSWRYHHHSTKFGDSYR